MRFLTRPFDWLDEWQERSWYWVYVLAYCAVSIALWVSLAVLIIWLWGMVAI